MLSVVSRFRVLAVAAAVAAVASLALVACEEQRRLPDYVAVALNDTTMRHPIGFDERREVLNVDLPPRASSLSHNQVADMQRFVARYKAEGVGRLAVSVASEARGSVGATQALDDLGRILKDSGVAPSQVAKSRHSDVHRTRAMVRLSYVRPTAVPPECGHWHRDIGRERERLHYPEFGCATQSNLAGHGRERARSPATPGRAAALGRAALSELEQVHRTGAGRIHRRHQGQGGRDHEEAVAHAVARRDVLQFAWMSAHSGWRSNCDFT